jgi:hypothetical protein
MVTLTDLDTDARVPPDGSRCRSGETGRRTGLKILTRGVAQVIDGLGNPLVIPGDSQFDPFSSLRLSLPRI